MAENEKNGKWKVLQLRGLRQRWIFNTVMPVLILLLLIVALFSTGVSNYYYSSVRDGLEKQVQAQAGAFNDYFMDNGYTSYYQKAVQSTSDFEDKGRIEMQFISSSGHIQISSTSNLTAGIAPGTSDITDAITGKKSAVFQGKDNETGEHILAVSHPLISNGKVVGVMRLVTSLRAVNRQVILAVLAICLVAVLCLTLVVLSSLLFINNVVEPVAVVTEAAKRISAGGYGFQIEKKYTDELGELVDNINDMSLKIGQNEKMKSEFISSVSHELRTPLTAITGWAETMQSGELRDPEDMKKGMEIILSEARRLTNMVEELLEFSRISDGRFTLSVEPLDLKAELEDAVYTYTEFFRREGIALEYTDCPEEMLPISGDPHRLRQVFCNLLDNAAKHGGSGKRIDVSIAREGEEAVIRIRDYGPGIPEGELPFIKNKFYKGSSKARGSGIGLAVCEEIVVRHEGQLFIGNAEGGGCLVVIRLPLDK